MRKNHDDFLAALAVLRERCPTIAPVRVRRTVLPADTLGYCNTAHCAETGALVRFDIRVSSEYDTEMQLRILYHEWAHALAFSIQNRDRTIDDHDEMWGVAYARVYREME